MRTESPASGLTKESRRSFKGLEKLMATKRDAAVVEVRSVSGGVQVPLRVQPKSRRPGVLGIHGGRLKIGVSEAPDRGKANKAVCETLAQWLGVTKSQVSIVAGETSQDKTALVYGTTVEALNAKLHDLGHG